jgi:hypothetical protein
MDLKEINIKLKDLPILLKKNNNYLNDIHHC